MLWNKIGGLEDSTVINLDKVPDAWRLFPFNVGSWAVQEPRLLLDVLPSSLYWHKTSASFPDTPHTLPPLGLQIGLFSAWVPVSEKSLPLSGLSLCQHLRKEFPDPVTRSALQVVSRASPASLQPVVNNACSCLISGLPAGIYSLWGDHLYVSVSPCTSRVQHCAGRMQWPLINGCFMNECNNISEFARMGYFLLAIW